MSEVVPIKQFYASMLAEHRKSGLDRLAGGGPILAIFFKQMRIDEYSASPSRAFHHGHTT